MCQAVVCLHAKNETAQKLVKPIRAVSFFVSSSLFCQKSVAQLHVELSEFEQLICACWIFRLKYSDIKKI
jgi:hypothetical protein